MRAVRREVDGARGDPARPLRRVPFAVLERPEEAVKMRAVVVRSLVELPARVIRSPPSVHRGNAQTTR